MDKTKDKEVELRKNNMKLYPFYEMIGYDVLFYYAIRVMFLSEVKLFNDSQIMICTTIYALFQILFQFPITLLVSKIGKRNGTIVGNICLIVWAILLMWLKDFKLLIISQLIFSLGFALKYISEANLLSDSIPEADNSNEIFTSIDKKGFSRYHFFSSVATVLSGFLFRINHYLPLICTLVFIILTTVLSFNFVDIEKRKQNKNKESQDFKKYKKELKQGYKFVINSKRLRALLLFTGVLWGVFTLLETYELLLLQNFNVEPQYIGLIFAALEFVKGIFSRRALIFNKLFKNRSLSNILASVSWLFIITGCISFANINYYSKIFTIIILLLIMASFSAIYQILTKKYFNNFTNTKILPSIYSVKYISDNVFRIILTLVGTILLMFLNIKIVILVTGIILVIATVFISTYADKKLGLDPEEYTQKDIYIRK